MGCATGACGSVWRVRIFSRRNFEPVLPLHVMFGDCHRRQSFVTNNADSGREGHGDDGMIPVTRGTSVVTHLQSTQGTTRTSRFCASMRQTKRNSQFFGIHSTSFCGMIFKVVVCFCWEGTSQEDVGACDN